MPPVDTFLADVQQAVAGRYVIEREIGRGGMGIVYLAHEIRLDRPVALKVLPPDRATDAGLRERFLREARTAARLAHPNIVPVFAAEEAGNIVFFAMPFVRGRTLADIVRQRGGLPFADAIRMLREVAWALAHAHAAGVIHRDVKADNVIVEEDSGRCQVADFGIARVAVATGVTGVGEAVGTPDYMSPEQICGDDLDGRSDIYSLGVLGFLLLAGRLPFEGTPPAVIAQHMQKLPPRLRDIGVPVSQATDDLVAQCLSKAREDRPASASELADRLSGLISSRPPIPTELRVASRVARRFTGVMIWIPVMVLFMSAIAFVDSEGIGEKIWIIGTTLLVAALGFWLSARSLASVREFGYDLDDIVRTLRREATDAVEEADTRDRPRAGFKPAPIRHGMLLAAALLIPILAGMAGDKELTWTEGFIAGGMLFGLLSAAGSLAFAAIESRGIRRWFAGAWHRYSAWELEKTPVRWVVDLIAGKRAPGPDAGRMTVARPTEVVLLADCRRMIDELPTPYRQRLEGIAPALKTLAAQVERLRPLANGGDGQARERLARSLAAIDGLRLDLMRLSTNTSSTSLDEAVSAAEAIAAHIDRVVAAEGTVRSLLGRDTPDPVNR